MNDLINTKLIEKEDIDDPDVNWLHPDHWKSYEVPTDYKGDLDNVDSTFNKSLMAEASNGGYMKSTKPDVWWVTALVITSQVVVLGSLVAAIWMLVKWHKDLSEGAFVLNTTLTCIPGLSIISVILTPLMKLYPDKFKI